MSCCCGSSSGGFIGITDLSYLELEKSSTAAESVVSGVATIKMRYEGPEKSINGAESDHKDESAAANEGSMGPHM